MERGVLPIFKGRRIRSKELRNCEPFTFIESIVRVKVVAAFQGPKWRELFDASHSHQPS